jgi:hypothetical protein
VGYGSSRFVPQPNTKAKLSEEEKSMRSLRQMKFIAVPVFIAIFALCSASLCCAQASGDPAGSGVKAKGPEKKSSASFGQKGGVQGSQASGDLTKSGVKAKGPEQKSSSSFGQKGGVQGSQSSGDLSKNRIPGKTKDQGSKSFGQKPGVQGSQASGDLAGSQMQKEE